jgi:hypothetical protein
MISALTPTYYYIQFVDMPGYQARLLELLTKNEIPVPVRQAAVILLKNNLSDNWKVKDGEASKISDDDRRVLKENMLEAIVFQTEAKVQSQLEKCLFTLAETDYPEKWPQLLVCRRRRRAKQRAHDVSCLTSHILSSLSL